MANIKEILLSVQERLGDAVPELGYIGKEQGQLSRENPGIAYPCALLEVRNIDYTQEGRGVQMADAQLTVTVAAPQPAAPEQGQDFAVIELLERIHAALHLFSTGGYAPLFRTNLKRIAADSAHERYEMTYQTAFETAFGTGATTREISGARLEIGRR